MFVDRRDAGRRLVPALMRFKDSDPCVLALPRGGVPVGFEVAQALDAPLDLVLVRKIGAPGQPEFAIGAVIDGAKPEVVLNRDAIAMLDIPERYLSEERERQIREIERRRLAYLGDRPRLDIANRTVLIVDDGIATGMTVKAAILAVRRHRPKRIILAIPVAPTDVVAALRRDVDDVVCLESYEHFQAIGLYYENFAQLSDEDVRDLLSQTPASAAPVTRADRERKGVTKHT